MVLGVGDIVTIAGGNLDRIGTISTIGRKFGRVTVDELSAIKKVENVSIKALPCPKVNNSGLDRAGFIADVIAKGLAAWATVQTFLSAKEEFDIGKSYYDLAKEQWDYFKGYYAPLEDQELSEIWAEKPHKPDYTQVDGTRAILHMDRQMQNMMKQYCLCPNGANLDIRISAIVGDADNYKRRYQERLALEKNNIRWARRISAISRGRGLLSSSASNASRAVRPIQERTKSFASIAQGAMEFSGYLSSRNKTVYNAPRQRIDGLAPLPDFENSMDVLGEMSNINPYESISRGGLVFGEMSNPYRAGNIGNLGGLGEVGNIGN